MPRGWAIECRITSEDPANGFLPSTGTISYLHLPSGPGVRWDGGIEVGSEIGLFYDPMLAKLIVHAPTREAAIERMHRALLELTIEGVETSRDFHLARDGGRRVPRRRRSRSSGSSDASIRSCTSGRRRRRRAAAAMAAALIADRDRRAPTARARSTAAAHPELGVRWRGRARRECEGLAMTDRRVDDRQHCRRRRWRWPRRTASWCSSRAPRPATRFAHGSTRRSDSRAAQLAQLVAPSPDRVEPPCSALRVDRCGGCQLQHMSYARSSRRSGGSSATRSRGSASAPIELPDDRAERRSNGATGAS